MHSVKAEGKKKKKKRVINKGEKKITSMRLERALSEKRDNGRKDTKQEKTFGEEPETQEDMRGRRG